MQEAMDKKLVDRADVMVWKLKKGRVCPLDSRGHRPDVVDGWRSVLFSRFFTKEHCNGKSLEIFISIHVPQP